MLTFLVNKANLNQAIGVDTFHTLGGDDADYFVFISHFENLSNIGTGFFGKGKNLSAYRFNILLCNTGDLCLIEGFDCYLL